MIKDNKNKSSLKTVKESIAGLIHISEMMKGEWLELCLIYVNLIDLYLRPSVLCNCENECGQRTVEEQK